jgi:hypothetical protein
MPGTRYKRKVARQYRRLDASVGQHSGDIPGATHRFSASTTLSPPTTERLTKRWWAWAFRATFTPLSHDSPTSSCPFVVWIACPVHLHVLVPVRHATSCGGSGGWLYRYSVVRGVQPVAFTTFINTRYTTWYASLHH